MTPEKLEEIKKNLLHIQNFDPAIISRVDELGSAFGFAECEQKARNAITVFKQIDVNFLNSLPQKHLKTVENQCNLFIGNVQKVMDLDISDVSNATAIRDNIINSFTKAENQYYNILSDVIAFQKAIAVSDEDRLAEEKRSLRQQEELLKEKEKQIDDALKKLEETEKEFSRLTDKLQAGAARSGVTQEAQHFHKEATEHHSGAVRWAWAIVFISSITLLFAWYSMFHVVPPKEVAEIINFVANKFMIFGVLLFLLSVATKNYMCNMHNKTVNRHRRNALLTYETLVSGAHTAEIKDTVLHSAASCIYSHQDSGYSKSGNNTGSTVNSIIETMPRTELTGKLADA